MHRRDVLKLGGEGVVAEPLGQGEVSLIVYTAAAQVWTDNNEAGLRQPLGQRGKHSPVLESLEAVQHQNGWPGRRSSAGPYIDQDLAERAGQRMFRESGCCHVEW